MGRVTIEENREGHAQIAAEPERYLAIPGLDHGTHHESPRQFLRSDWTGDEARRARGRRGADVRHQLPRQSHRIIGGRPRRGDFCFVVDR